jgi:hypothetical protein
MFTVIVILILAQGKQSRASREPVQSLGVLWSRTLPQRPGTRNDHFLSSSQNVGGGTSVVQVRATDRDTGINSVLSYYITEGNEDMTFRMDRMSGEIATRPAPPDREHQSFYHLVVTVEDEGTPTLSVSIVRARGQLYFLCERS